ncbi:hypothetical protein [Synechococcus elongatus]|uniref:hypothetical protein n=1 Tax=Synechococcus elongatus TaxID=32046 RepID=UPI00137513A2|nr:hypothetical protein [Synechococcus elongatus]
MSLAPLPPASSVIALPEFGSTQDDQQIIGAQFVSFSGLARLAHWCDDRTIAQSSAL